MLYLQQQAPLILWVNPEAGVVHQSSPCFRKEGSTDWASSGQLLDFAVLSLIQ